MEEPAITRTALRRCRIYYITAGQGLSWGWRSEDDRTSSHELFPLFYDCVEDARCNGFYVDLERQPDNAVHMHSPAPGKRPSGKAAARSVRAQR